MKLINVRKHDYTQISARPRRDKGPELLTLIIVWITKRFFIVGCSNKP